MKDVEKAARVEALFREVNERIVETAGGFGGDDARIVCECDQPSCTERIHIPLDDYEEVRAEPTRFLVAEGHGEDAIERVVDRGEGFEVVEKDEPTAAEIVEDLDPRQ